MINVSLPQNVDPAISRAIKEIARRSVDGAVENYRALKHRLANTADSSPIANTASETNFDVNRSLSTIQMQPGRIFKLRAYGVYSTTGTPTLQFRVKVGSTNLVVFTAKTGINNASNQSWMLEAEIVVRSLGASGTVMTAGRISINTSSGVDTVETVVNNAAISMDTTAVQTLQVSLQWSAASSSNTATLKTLSLEVSDF